MSGFTISLDAILAIAVAGVLLASATELLVSKEHDGREELLAYAHDFLAVADKSGILASVTKGRTSEFKSYIRRMPASYCMEAEISFQNGDFFYYADNRCTESQSFVSASRIIAVNDKIYPITVKLWYR